MLYFAQLIHNNESENQSEYYLGRYMHSLNTIQFEGGRFQNIIIKAEEEIIPKNSISAGSSNITKLLIPLSN